MNQHLTKKISSVRDSIKKDNELFRAEIINLTYRKINKAKAEFDVQLLVEKCAARKDNLIIVGVKESQEGELDLQAVATR